MQLIDLRIKADIVFGAPIEIVQPFETVFDAEKAGEIFFNLMQKYIQSHSIEVVDYKERVTYQFQKNAEGIAWCINTIAKANPLTQLDKKPW